MENRGPINVSSDFGALLRRHRLAAGLSQQSLAERAGLSIYGISALERGYRKTPQFETLSLLAGALALNEEQRREFLAAAKPGAVRGKGSVTVGPWATATSANLPLSVSRFVGRGAELEEIAAFLAQHWLVTITGAGGIGKTQTALRVATGARDTTDRAICFVALASIDDPSLVVATIAAALGVQEVPNHPQLETLTAYLSSKTLILVLDNCEHVIAEAAIVADSLLRACPNLRILATSREPLRVAGERRYRLPSLNAADATALFADRAQAVDPHFALTYDNAPIIARVCQRLDGIPLALELAAARVDALSLETLARKLDARFAALAVGSRTAPSRHQTMRATIEWSYNLLAPPEQRVFERLSVFAGRFTLDAATTVCADDNVPEGAIVDLLSSLVDKSLVLAEFDETESRYRLLEPFREYAREVLGRRGEQNSVAHRHAFACREMIERFNRSESSNHEVAWRRLHQSELDDWRSALTWSLVELGDVALGQELVGSLYRVWYRLPVEGRRWVAAAGELVTQRTPARILARLKFAEAHSARSLRDWEKQLASANRAAELFGEIGEALMANAAMSQAGQALGELGRLADSEAVLLQVIANGRSLGDPQAYSHALHMLALVRGRTGDLGAARKYFTEAVAVYQEHNRTGNVAAAIIDLSHFEFEAGDVESALSNATRALAMSRPNNDPNLVGFSLIIIARCLALLDRFSEAAESAREALALTRENQRRYWSLVALWELATIAAVRPEVVVEQKRFQQVRAARILGFAEAGLGGFTEGKDEYDRQRRDRPIDALRGALGSVKLAELMAVGAKMSEEQAFEEASEL